MRKIFYCIIVQMMMFSWIASATVNGKDALKAAYIKDHQLWIKMGHEEKKVTFDDEKVTYSKWSYDGDWLAYLKSSSVHPVYESELWVYSLKLEKHFKIAANIDTNFQWAPNSHKLGFLTLPNLDLVGFQSKQNLYVADISNGKTVYQVSSKISNFSWFPDGKGILTSSKVGDKIDSNILISRVNIEFETKKTTSSPLTMIPVDKDEFFITTSMFEWSYDHKWISFLLIPTASLSADANTLCILSEDGREFRKVGDMLNDNAWFEWAPSSLKLGFIRGAGREATKNKKLKVLKILDQTKVNYTSSGLVDRDLTWVTNKQLITSRSKEEEWGDVHQRPMPALYQINIQTNEQKKISNPSRKSGDFRPQMVNRNLVWIRTDRQTADVWISSLDGSEARKWISMIDLGSWYYEKWNWDEVFSIYQKNK